MSVNYANLLHVYHMMILRVYSTCVGENLRRVLYCVTVRQHTQLSDIALTIRRADLGCATKIYY